MKTNTLLMACFVSVHRRKRAQDARVAASGSVLRLSLLKGISAQIVAAAVRLKSHTAEET